MGEATDEVGSTAKVYRADLESSSATSSPRVGSDAGDGGEEATQIRSGIEQTRAEMSETIDALQNKLDPARIAEQVKDQIRDKAVEAYDTAKSAVKEATIGRAGKIVSSVSESVTEMTGAAGTAVSQTSSSVGQYIRDNPVPFALVGIGLGMLAFNKRQAQPSWKSPTSTGTDRGATETITDKARAAADRARGVVSSATSTVRDAAASAADTTRQQFQTLSGQARQGADLTSDRFKSTLEENPMAAGLAALAAGAIVGLTLPATRLEGEYMGRARDRVVDQAKSVAQEAAGKVQRVTEEAGRSLKDAAQKEGIVTSS